MMSTGLPWLQVGGNTRSSCSTVVGANMANRPPRRFERIGRKHAGAAAIG